MDVLERIGHTFPEEWVDKADRLMKAAGREVSGARFIGFWFVMSLIIVLISLFLFLRVEPFSTFTLDLASSLTTTHTALAQVLVALAVALFTAFIVVILAYSYNGMLADMRREAVESVLPDFLVLVASNMRSGMSLDQAMWQASSPEFGILAIEVRKAIKESFAGTPLDKALEKLAQRIHSQFFQRTIDILRQAIKSGGEIARVLEKTSEEARSFYITKREVRASLIVYVIFLVFAASLGVPFLLAVSQKMLEVLYAAFSIAVGGVDVTASVIRGLNVGMPPVTPKDFFYFSLIMIFISNFLTAFIIGATYTGNKNDGIRYLPFMLLLAYIVFFLSLGALDSLFSSML